MITKKTTRLSNDEARVINPKAMEFLDFCHEVYGKLFNETMNDIGKVDKKFDQMTFDDVQSLYHKVMVLRQVVEVSKRNNDIACFRAVSDLKGLEEALQKELVKGAFDDVSLEEN